MINNTCPTSPYSKKNPYGNKGKITNPIQSPYSDRNTPYNAISSPTEPIKTPYSRKNPYNQKSSIYSKITSPFLDKAKEYLAKENPYIPNHYCPLSGQFLLIDSLNFLVIDSAGNKLNING
jgi:hypothetical protein